MPLPPVLIATSCFVVVLLSGCGTATPPPNAKADPTAVAPASPTTDVVVSPKSETSDVSAPATVEAPNAPVAGKSVAQAASDPVKSAAVKPPVVPPAVAKAPPAPPKPTAEQIARWNIIESVPLKLLACLDAVDDPFIQTSAVSPDGKQFVLAGSKLTLWNLGQAEPATNLLENVKSNEFDRPVRSVEFSPDGTRLAAGDRKGNLLIWNLSDQQLIVKKKPHQGQLVQMAYSPDSKQIATTSYSGDVVISDAESGEKIKTLKIGQQELRRLLYLSDTRLAAIGREASIWDTETSSKLLDFYAERLNFPTMALNRDRSLLAFSDSQSNLRFWDVKNSEATEPVFAVASAALIAFSNDGKPPATYSTDSTIRIWDGKTGKVVQVIDADGGRTAGVNWLPQADVLLVVSENGRIRLWGQPESADAIGIKPIELPPLETVAADTRKPASSEQLVRTLDLRSLPKLPVSTAFSSSMQTDSYTSAASEAEAGQFYRHVLGNAGWVEPPNPDGVVATGLNFRKDGNQLLIYVTPTPPVAPATSAGVQLTLMNQGNFDSRWLPKIDPIKTQSEFSSFGSTSYRTKMELSDLEVAILKTLHESGWTASSRLNASSNEDPGSRMITFHQGGIELNVFISSPANAPSELAVQMSVGVTTKSLPIPPDSGWIEFDNSTELAMVANTKLNLNQTIEFYDARMKSEGWLAREAGRATKELENETRAWLPYVKGQQDVLIRLVTRPENQTRIIVGDAERSSWQLAKPAKPNTDNEKPGLEAADFPVPKTASNLKFDVDQKQIHFDLPVQKASAAAQTFTEPLSERGWKREDGGVISDDYTLATFKQGKAEVQLRVRSDEKRTSVIASGDEMLWTKPLPTAPVRISYGTWLRRNLYASTLDRLDEFAAEMKAIPKAAK